jgi:hypothetical protein
MKHKLSTGIILSLFLCIFIPFSYAYDGESHFDNYKGKNYFSERKRIVSETLDRLEIGVEIYHFTYKEPGLMKDKGMMYGIFGSYTYRGWAPPAPETMDKWMLRAELRYAFGEVDYDGGLSDGTPYTIDNIDDYVWEVRGLCGYDFPIFKASILTPYAGIGYRYLNDDPSFDPYGYERESNYVYSPIGLEIATNLDRGWFVGATLEYDIFWSGKQKSHLSNVDPGYNDLENDQDSGYGVRGSIKLQKECDKFTFIIEPFVRYWRIRCSESAIVTWRGIPWGYGVEPKNRTTEFGVKLAATF